MESTYTTVRFSGATSIELHTCATKANVILTLFKKGGASIQTPNLTFVSGESSRLNTPIIRGMAMIDSRGFDNNVGVFVDGVYVSGWVKNAFDEDAPDFAQIFQSDLNSFRPVASIVGIPRRRVGLTARFRF